jgi:hypothetical protein
LKNQVLPNLKPSLVIEQEQQEALEVVIAMHRTFVGEGIQKATDVLLRLLDRPIDQRYMLVLL